VNLTPEQQEIGRRNFLKIAAGLPALAGLGTAAAMKGPLHGGPVRVGFIGVGGEGRVLLGSVDAAFAEVVAMADINPTQLARADEVLQKTKKPAAKHYAEWKDMIQQEELEAVIIAVPLWAHADITVGCLDAGLHVLCEKMMAWDEAGCQRMIQASIKNNRLLEIGYQRFYNPVYQAAYSGIIKAGVLGDIYHSRIVWHRNGTWRRKADPPSPTYDPSKWGYPTFDHLINWRLYNKYSRGLLAELASHQLNVTNWFFDSSPTAVIGTGGVYRFPEGGRELPDHVFTTWDYPGGRTVQFSSIESNAFDRNSETFFGTKGTLIMQGETEAYLFEEGSAASPRATNIEVTPRGNGPALEASESRAADAAGRQQTASAATPTTTERLSSYRNEISGFCASVRTGAPLACGAERASHSAIACIRAWEAVDKKARIEIPHVGGAPATKTT
jgi:predicted dehydrogenase